MDIRFSEHEKRIVTLGTSLFRKKIGKKASVENVSKYLRGSKNKGFLEMLDVLDFIVDNTTGSHQKRHVKEYVEFALFLAINHPEMRKGLEGMIKTYTKYPDSKIDLKPCLSRTDKFILEHVIKYIFKKFNERVSFKAIVIESNDSPNKIARYFLSNLETALIDVKDDFIHKSIGLLSWLGLWIAINDTAYRHQFYYAVNKVGNEKLHELSNDFYFEPEDWYINVYTYGVADTRKQWEENVIPRHENSVIESPCVVPKQQNIFKKYIEKYGVK